VDYQDGQTKVISGTTYVRQNGLWHAQGPMMGVPRTPAPQTPDQAVGQSLQNQHTAQEIQAQPLQNASTQANIQQSYSSVQNQHFNQNQGLRQEFDNLPEVKNYSVALGSLGSALKAPDTPQGDLALIYAYAKAADPGSVVREGEMDMAKATASLPQQFQADAQRLTQGKRLPPQVRVGLIEAMRQSVSGLKQTYDLQRSRFAAVAQKNGIPPDQVLGPPLYDAIRPLEEQYIRAHGGTPRDPNAPLPQMEGDFGLQDKAHRLTPEQAAKDQAFLATKPNAQQYSAFLETLIGRPVDPALTEARLKASNAGGIYTDEVQDPRVAALLDHLKQKGGAGDSAAVGATQGITLNAADELASAGAALKGSLSGQGSFGDLYNVNEQANQGYSDFLQQQHPLPYGLGELGGGAALAPLTFGAETPAQLAGLSGAMGAVGGFNGGQGGFANRALGATEGGIAGAALGYAIPKGLSMIPRRGATEVPPLVDPQTGQLNQPFGSHVSRSARGEGRGIRRKPARRRRWRPHSRRYRQGPRHHARFRRGDGGRSQGH
jgi:hypothetical protein